MSVRDLLRALTPLGRLLAVAACMAVALLVLGATGWRWDPLRLDQRRADRAEAQAAAAASDAAARGLEAEGEAALRRRGQSRAQTSIAVAASTAIALDHARTADDADTPLEPGRAVRLRRHDDELCRLAPHLVGCAPAPDAG